MVATDFDPVATRDINISSTTIHLVGCDRQRPGCDLEQQHKQQQILSLVATDYDPVATWDDNISSTTIHLVGCDRPRPGCDLEQQHKQQQILWLVATDLGRFFSTDMSSKYDPPQFIDNLSGYPEYKNKLLRWSRITKVPQNKQAEVVLYHLQGHPSGIQEKADAALGNAVEDKDDGLTKLIGFLDTIYAQDEMSEAWSMYKQFTQLKKKHDQPITEFIAEFDKAHSKAKESGCDFSDTVLGFTLLESCELGGTDEKFILTAVDFKEGKEKKNLLEQIKNSLRKFQSRERLSLSDSGRIQVKEEEAFVSQVKEALLRDGWKPPGKSRPMNSPAYKGKKNPLDENGIPLRCFKCDSEYHMADKCNKQVKDDSEKGMSLATLLTSNASRTEYYM